MTKGTINLYIYYDTYVVYIEITKGTINLYIYIVEYEELRACMIHKLMDYNMIFILLLNNTINNMFTST